MRPAHWHRWPGPGHRRGQARAMAARPTAGRHARRPAAGVQAAVQQPVLPAVRLYAGPCQPIRPPGSGCRLLARPGQPASRDQRQAPAQRPYGCRGRGLGQLWLAHSPTAGARHRQASSPGLRPGGCSLLAVAGWPGRVWPAALGGRPGHRAAGTPLPGTAPGLRLGGCGTRLVALLWCRLAARPGRHTAANMPRPRGRA